MSSNAPDNVFAKWQQKAWPHRFDATIRVESLVGGTPSDPQVIEGWIRSKFVDQEDAILALIAETMVERACTLEEATDEVTKLKTLNGFKRDRDTSELFYEGRQLKSAIREAISVSGAAGALPTGQVWGATRKGLTAFANEHIMVVENRIGLGVKEPSRVLPFIGHPTGPQGRRSTLTYYEVVEDVDLHFTIITDYAFSEEHWAMIWLKGALQGVGALRSQGFGRYMVTRWDEAPPVRARAARKSR